MLKDILNNEVIHIKEEVATWEEAIKIAANPLILNDTINEKYVESMINNVHNHGPYIVIAPDIAIAHARPENNIKKVGLSLLKLHKRINFAEDSHYASLVFVLAAVDDEQHLGVLSELAEILGDSSKVTKLKDATTVEEIQQLI